MCSVQMQGTQAVNAIFFVVIFFMFLHSFVVQRKYCILCPKEAPLNAVPQKIISTSYVGIIRIRLKGRRSTFLSACHTSSPAFNCPTYCNAAFLLLQVFFSPHKEGFRIAHSHPHHRSYRNTSSDLLIHRETDQLEDFLQFHPAVQNRKYHHPVNMPAE